MKYGAAIWLACFSTLGFAQYNDACLRQCACTGHDCYFCGYICEDDSVPKAYPYRNEPCDLEYYDNDRNY